MEAWGTLPLADRPQKRQVARNPNWTLGNDDQPQKRTSTTGVEMERQRGAIEGSKTALKQFAARNQRIIADPYPGRNCFPRGGPLVPQSSVASTRVTYNPVLQQYQSRDVAGAPAATRGLASTSCCFGVDPAIGSREWRSTQLNVGDITTATPTQRSSRPQSARPTSVKPEWWGS
jgi:hypothetical protein